jgi:Protein of unknown function (DUF2889)
MTGGPSDPLSAVPVLRERTLRRTMHVDVGPAGEWPGPERRAAHLEITGAARDVRGPNVLAHASLRARFDPSRVLVGLETDPEAHWAEAMIGTRAGGGFRRHLAKVVREVVKQADPIEEPGGAAGLTTMLLRQLLEDLPAAALISGYASLRLARRRGASPGELTPPVVLEHMSDMCSGWRSDGTAAKSIAAGAGVPVQDCPVAPVLELRDVSPRSAATTSESPTAGSGATTPESPTAGSATTTSESATAGSGATTSESATAGSGPWHPIPTLGADCMRRRRLVDVSFDEGGSTAGMWAMFRDTVGEPDGSERVLHEYVLEGRLVRSDRGMVLASVRAEPRVLPFSECPAAAAAVGALVGTAVADLTSAVPEVLFGVSSCTHLNDLLRNIGGLAGLLAAS